MATVKNSSCFLCDDEDNDGNISSKHEPSLVTIENGEKKAKMCLFVLCAPIVSI